MAKKPQNAGAAKKYAPKMTKTAQKVKVAAKKGACKCHTKGKKKCVAAPKSFWQKLIELFLGA